MLIAGENEMWVQSSHLHVCVACVVGTYTSTWFYFYFKICLCVSMFMSSSLSAAGDGLPSLWQQLWEQHWWSRVDFSAMSVMHILSSRRIMLSLCLQSGSGCKWDVKQMEVFNGLRVIQTIFSLASKKKARTVAWPLRRVQEHPVHGLETGHNPLTVPVAKKDLVLSKCSIPCTPPAVGTGGLHSIHSCH